MSADLEAASGDEEQTSTDGVAVSADEEEAS